MKIGIYRKTKKIILLFIGPNFRYDLQKITINSLFTILIVLELGLILKQ